jgi:hypothetical protein
MQTAYNISVIKVNRWRHPGRPRNRHEDNRVYYEGESVNMSQMQAKQL